MCDSNNLWVKKGKILRRVSKFRRKHFYFIEISYMPTSHCNKFLLFDIHFFSIPNYCFSFFFWCFLVVFFMFLCLRIYTHQKQRKLFSGGMTESTRRNASEAVFAVVAQYKDAVEVCAFHPFSFNKAAFDLFYFVLSWFRSLRWGKTLCFSLWKDSSVTWALYSSSMLESAELLYLYFASWTSFFVPSYWRFLNPIQTRHRRWQKLSTL